MIDRAAHWTYYIEFFSIPPIATLLAGYALASLPPVQAFALFTAGLWTWTFLEYWIHRVVLHHFPYFSDQHDVHHEEPKSYIGVNSFGVLAAYAVVGLSLGQLFSFPVSAAFIAGIMAMYVVYISIHHQLHHRNRRRFGPMMTHLWEHHASHHRGGNYDFGVSTTLWDMIFRTKR